jgi:hypothetical protein
MAKKKLKAGNIITIELTSHSAAVWKGHPPAKFDSNNRSLHTAIDLYESSILLVVQAPFNSKEVSNFWLRCLHPVLGPITLDAINSLGYAVNKDYATYKIVLHE